MIVKMVLKFLALFQVFCIGYFVACSQGSDWTKALEMCNARGENMFPQPSLNTSNGRTDALCDLAVGEIGWLDSVLYHLGCNNASGECDYLEVSHRAVGTKLDVLCQNLGTGVITRFSGISPTREYERAIHGCAQFPGARGSLANLTDAAMTRKLINTGHLTSQTAYWIGDISLSNVNKTCRSIERRDYLGYQLVYRQCDLEAKPLCTHDLHHRHYQKAARYLRTSSPDSFVRSISQNCMQSGNPITVVSRAVTLATTSTISDKNDTLNKDGSNIANEDNSTSINYHLEMNKLPLYLSIAVPGTVLLFCLIAMVIYCCLRKTTEVTYSEPKDAIKQRANHYAYEHPYDKRNPSDGIITVKALQSDKANYDYPDVLLNSDRSGDRKTTSESCSSFQNSDSSHTYDYADLKPSETQNVKICRKGMDLSNDTKVLKQDVQLPWRQVKVPMVETDYSDIEVDTEGHPDFLEKSSTLQNTSNQSRFEEPVYL